MSVKCTRDKQNEDSSFSIIVYPRVLELLYRASQPPASWGRRHLTGHARLPPPASCAHQTHTLSIAASTVVAQLRRDVHRHRHTGRTPPREPGAPARLWLAASPAVPPFGNTPSTVWDGEDGWWRGKAHRGVREGGRRGLAREVTVSRTSRCKNTQSKIIS